MLRELFLVLHGDALGYKLAEHEGKERENERYHDNGCGIYYTDTALGDIKGADGKARQPLCEVVGSECRAEKAGKGDAYLNSREKARRLLDHFQHLFRFLSPSSARALTFFSFSDITAISVAAKKAFNRISISCNNSCPAMSDIFM